jgi:demethylmenaquinone methyltransferase/2-methoxy-6-polyprenyl-1,4-benzoquinol methylase
MFDRIAERYDLANTLFSLGHDRHWRRVAVRAVDPRPGGIVLDVAAGTGALSAGLAASGARVVPLDLSWAMLATGAARQGRGLWWTNGDAPRLPFATGTFDAVTIAFGLRNLPDPSEGLAELARVTRRGGRLLVLEFATPTWSPVRSVYQRCLLGAIPFAAKAFTADPRAYRYLADSIRAWPDQATLAGSIAANGWTEVRWTNLTGGIVAAHHAVRG